MVRLLKFGKNAHYNKLIKERNVETDDKEWYNL